MKLVKTSFGLMTPLEAKMIGDIDKEAKVKKQNEKIDIKSNR
ncbi:hypothetical protein [Companilactobacillus nantensis]|nr:hypothetical protein [Companilactobacillus nantensis]GEO63027.1 hypothetical protein LNA01_02100 [Companilactobacillus nantensis]